MKVSASVFSNPDLPLQQVVKALDACKTDLLHVDCNDDPGVFDTIAEIRSYSDTPVDLHIITGRPELYIPLVEKCKPEYVQFQYEHLPSGFEHPFFEHSKTGLCIVSDTDWNVFRNYADRCRHILFMATTPGQSGGRFNTENFRRIRAFKKEFPGTRIHVDGGVNGEVSFILRSLGVDCIISGSFLVKNDNPAMAMLDLLHREIHSDYKVGDFMIGLQELPLIPMQEASFFRAVEVIDAWKFGFVIYTDSRGRLAGITTNADLRRALLKNRFRMEEIPAEDYINPDPFFCYDSDNVTTMLSKIKSARFPVLYLPVIAEDRTLTGALAFQQLIKGE